MSLSVRRPRERDKKDDLSDGGLKRSSSMKGRSETKGDVITRDPEEKKEQKADKQKGEITNGPHPEHTCLRSFRQGEVQTRVLGYGD